jgi:polygalacturonase
MSDYRSITEAGISCDGSAPCAAALNRIFKDSPGAWYFPAGNYRIEETLKLPSGTQLRLSDKAVLRLEDGAATCNDDYLLTNADPKSGNQLIRIEGGTFDGNQVGNPRPEGLLDEGYSGAMIHFQNVSDLEIRNCTFTNAEAYYARFTQVNQFTIESINFDSEKVRPNNDGIHLGGHCQNGTIRKLRALSPGVTGDDMVALNADDALQRTEVRGMTNGPIEHITIEDIEAESCHTFVRILSVTSPIRNVTIRGLRGGCINCVINADGARRCRVPVFDEANPPFSDGVGILENIHISDLSVWKTHQAKHALIDIHERCRNLTIENFQRLWKHDQAPNSPSIRFKHFILQNAQLDADKISGQNLLDPNPAYESTVDQFKSLVVNESSTPFVLD